MFSLLGCQLSSREVRASLFIFMHNLPYMYLEKLLFRFCIYNEDVCVAFNNLIKRCR